MCAVTCRSNDVKKMHSEHAAMQGQLIQAEARAQAAEARCLELEALGAPQQQQQQELAAAFGPVLAQVRMQKSIVSYPMCLELVCRFPLCVCVGVCVCESDN